MKGWHSAAFQVRESKRVSFCSIKSINQSWIYIAHTRKASNALYWVCCILNIESTKRLMGIAILLTSIVPELVTMYIAYLPNIYLTILAYCLGWPEWSRTLPRPVIYTKSVIFALFDITYWFFSEIYLDQNFTVSLIDVWLDFCVSYSEFISLSDNF